MAFSQYQMCLRPTPQPPPDHWSAPAPPFAAPESSASATSHPKLPVLRPRRFGAAPTQVQHIRNPPRTGTSPSRRGERHHHTHSRLHPASRAAMVSERGRCAPPSTDPPPKAEDRRRSLSKVHRRVLAAWRTIPNTENKTTKKISEYHFSFIQRFSQQFSNSCRFFSGMAIGLPGLRGFERGRLS